MNCEKCGTAMHWEGSMRSGHMACIFCKHLEQLPSIKVDCVAPIFNAQPNPSAPAFSVKRDCGSLIIAVQCPNCGEEFFTNKRWSSAECPACQYCGVIDK